MRKEYLCSCIANYRLVAYSAGRIDAAYDAKHNKACNGYADKHNILVIVGFKSILIVRIIPYQKKLQAYTDHKEFVSDVKAKVVFYQS